MSDFSDRPFVAGSLIGIRSFKPVGEWLLAPVQHTMSWRPGENVAECRRPPFSVIPDEPHQVASVDCRCGFYAYFHVGFNPHHERGNILGLIEGYGVVTVGARGFRCEKARIVALINPDPPNYDLGFVFAKYPDVPVFPSVEAAVAEFPLTVPEGTPEPVPVGIRIDIATSGLASLAQQFKAMADAISKSLSQTNIDMAKLAEALRAAKPCPDETPPSDVKDRALHLRRNRNTGPADPHHLSRRRARNQP